jgi:hypothetical protein
LFWDYASLPQPNEKTGERSGQDQQTFMRGLKTIEFLYSGALTIVVQLKNLPADPYEHMNRTQYDNRGWCYFEEVLAVTMKSGFQLLNLSLAHDRLADYSDWTLVASAAQSDIRPPIHPEHLRQELIYKSFSVASDLDMLMTKYSNYFFSTVPAALEVNLPDPVHILNAKTWGGKEMDSLVRSLPVFTSIMKLNLRGRFLGDSGAEKLAKLLPSMTRLDTLWLHNSEIGNKGVGALAPALREVRDLRDLRLHGCRFREAGLRDLCDIAFFPWIERKDIIIEKEEPANSNPTEGLDSLNSIREKEKEKAPEPEREVKPDRDRRSWLRLAKLEMLTLPLELAKTTVADTIERLTKTHTAQRSQLIVKWLPA